MPPNQIGFRYVLRLSVVPLAECQLLHYCEHVYLLAFLPSQVFSRPRLLQWMYGRVAGIKSRRATQGVATIALSCVLQTCT